MSLERRINLPRVIITETDPSERKPRIMFEDVKKRIKSREIEWREVPPEVKKELIEKAAEERGIPSIMLTRIKLSNSFTFLDGHSLIGLYEYTREEEKKKNPNKIQLDIVARLIKENDVTVTLEDVQTALSAKRLFWGRVPFKTWRKVLDTEAVKLGIAPALLTDDIVQSCLENNSLKSLYTYVKHLGYRERNGKGVFEYIFIRTEVQYIFENLVEITKFKNRNILWSRVPDDVLRNVLDEAAQHLEIPVSFLRKDHLEKNHFEFLNGRTLAGLYNYAESQNREENETPLVWLRRKVGIPEPPSGQRNNYRIKQMLRIFEKEIGENNFYAHLSQVTANDSARHFEPFMPWILAVTQLYRRFFQKIPRNETLNQVFVSFAEELENSNYFSLNEFISFTNIRIEKFVSDQMAEYYKNKTLSTKIGDTNMTLGDGLASTEEALDESVIFKSEIEAALRMVNLSPLQKDLIRGITIRGLSFKQMAQLVNADKKKYAMNSEVDSDILQDHYEKTLATTKQREVNSNQPEQDLNIVTKRLS